jgi:hypothetical protein
LALATSQRRHPTRQRGGTAPTPDGNGITRLGSADLHASGELFPLWGGNKISGALGGEFRFEVKDEYRPPYVGLYRPAARRATRPLLSSCCRPPRSTASLLANPP